MTTEWTPERVNSLVSRFGGIRAMADKLGHKHVTTVRWWVEKGYVPRFQEGNIILAAHREGIPLPKWFRNGGPA